MNLFQSVKKLYQTVGVYTTQSDQIYAINLNFVFFSLSIALSFISMFAYFLIKAESIEDYGSSFYTSTAGLNALVNVFIMFWQMPTALQLIQNSEQFIAKSKKKHF